jgi:hypothetical protein
VASYRLRVDLTYSTTNNATTATTNLNTALAAAGRVEQAQRSTAAVSLLVDGITQAEAVALRDALTPAWAAGPRSQGSASVVRIEGT